MRMPIRASATPAAGALRWAEPSRVGATGASKPGGGAGAVAVSTGGGGVGIVGRNGTVGPAPTVACTWASNGAASGSGSATSATSRSAGGSSSLAVIGSSGGALGRAAMHDDDDGHQEPGPEEDSQNGRHAFLVGRSVQDREGLWRENGRH